MNKKLLIVINVDWLFLVHRLSIAKEALNQGFNVAVLTKNTGRSKEIEQEGITFQNLEISRSGTKIVEELKTLKALYSFYKKTKPNLIYHVTMKPVIYGTLMAKFLNINTVNGISGLGYNFTANRRGKVQKAMITLMKYAFNKNNNTLVFENKDDYKELKNLNIVSPNNDYIFTKGVGVDLNKFKPIEKTKDNSIKIILLPTRMLWDKGVKEFIEAANILKEKFIGNVKFILCGQIDEGNKEAVAKEYLENSNIVDYIEWIGYRENMVEVYRNSDIVVLPSYREGMPTVLIEACAMGKPVITTNAVGCKECVDEGVNGYKISVASSIELANAIEKMMNSEEKLKEMGLASRRKAEKEFDQKLVIKAHLDVFKKLINFNVG